MSACSSSASYSGHRLAGTEQQRRVQAAPAPGPARPHVNRPSCDHHTPSPARRLTVRTRASAAAAELATYQFAQRRGGTTAEWFQLAVRDIVKKLDQSPFLQTVQLPLAGGSPRFNTFGVHESVVSVPELWQGVAEHVSSHSPDVVILVQRVSPHAPDSPQGAIDAATPGASPHGAAGAASSSGFSSSMGSSSMDSSSPPGSPRSPASHDMRVQAEEACRRLVSSGLADSILQGQVGDCCDGSGHGHSHGDDAHSHDAHNHGHGSHAEQQRQASPRPLPLPAIVPFTPSQGRRTAVRAAALRPAGSLGAGGGSCQHSACYWGVVVQSRQHTGVEGCYLLKTVRNVSPGGCSCTHFSLTRITAGEHLEQQFVQSWLL